MYCRWRSSYQEGVIVIPLTGLILLHLCAYPKSHIPYPKSHIPSPISQVPYPKFHILSPISQIPYRNVICCGLLFYSMSSVKMKGDSTFSWYWWNWWPALLKLSFHNQWKTYSHLVYRLGGWWRSLTCLSVGWVVKVVDCLSVGWVVKVVDCVSLAQLWLTSRYGLQGFEVVDSLWTYLFLISLIVTVV